MAKVPKKSAVSVTFLPLDGEGRRSTIRPPRPRKPPGGSYASLPDLRADAVRAADRIAASLASDFAKQAAEAAASDDDAEPDFNATREEPASAVLRKGDVTGGDDS